MKIINVWVLSFVVLFAAAQNAGASKLDLDYTKTSPTKAVLCSALIPGGGHYYLSDANPKYRASSITFFGIGVGSYLWLGSEVKRGGELVFPAMVLFTVLRILEFVTVSDDADAERLTWFKKNFVLNDNMPGTSLKRKIFLKDGSIVEGKSTGTDGDYIKVETIGGSFTIPLKDVLRMETDLMN